MKRTQNWRDYLNDENYQHKQKFRKKGKKSAENETDIDKKQYKRK